MSPLRRRLLTVLAVIGLGPALAAAGPQLSSAQFFETCIDLSIPEMSAAAEAARRGQFAEAEHCFAEYVRTHLDGQRLNRRWLTKSYSEAARRRLTEKAEAAMECRIAVAGCAEHRYPDRRIDWLGNPTYNQYREWTFQLSRMPFWNDLAEYYTLTRDERAAECWVSQLSSWLDQAPAPSAGTCPFATKAWRTIEVGIRLERWSHQLAAFVPSPALTDEMIVRFFRSICEHGRRLMTSGHSRGNWVVIEKGGLLRIGVLYPFLIESGEWRRTARARLLAELDAQIYPDGFQAELSTGYQGVIIDIYGGLLDLYADLQLSPPRDLAAGFERIFEPYPKLMMPDGRTPDLNDGGRKDVAAEMRRALHFYPQREDWRYFASGGSAGTIPTFRSCAFPYAGAVVMRSGWGRDDLWAYLDCSPFGMAHQHEDKLNLLLQAYGKDMITEGGNYFYDTSAMRDYVQSTRAHNTVRVDGKDQNRRRHYRWRPADIAKPANFTFKITEAAEWATATYDEGYGDDERTVHWRTLLWLKKAKPGLPFFVVIDRLTAPDERLRTYEILWHLEARSLALAKNSFVADYGDGVKLSATMSDESATFVDRRGQQTPEFQGGCRLSRPVRMHIVRSLRRLPSAGSQALVA